MFTFLAGGTPIYNLSTFYTIRVILINPQNQKGKLPALGWNSWNAYGCDVNETKIVTAATQLNSSGLQALGYQYVNSERPIVQKNKSNS
jgi:hypothetical protein